MLRKDDAKQLGQHVAELIKWEHRPVLYDDSFSAMCKKVNNLNHQLLVCVAARLIMSDGFKRTESYIQRCAQQSNTPFAENLMQVVHAASNAVETPSKVSKNA